MLKTGDSAPNFEAEDEQGIIRRSKNIKGKYLVLFFYPKDDTPGCTAEACLFRDRYLDFQKSGAEIWGISEGNKDSHLQFSQKNNLPFPLICDRNNDIRKLFSVPKSFGIIPGRVTFVINKQGLIKHIFNNLLNGPAHVEEALKIILQ